jgi:hypothetical protein
MVYLSIVAFAIGRVRVDGHCSIFWSVTAGSLAVASVSVDQSQWECCLLRRGAVQSWQVSAC